MDLSSNKDTGLSDLPHTARNPLVEKTPEPLSQQPLQVIEPSKSWAALDLPSIWQYRELLYFLTWRDIKIRYQQTVLGAAWAILQPVLTMVVFSLLFGRLAGLNKSTGDVPYPLFVYAGLLPWTFFANAVTASGNSLVGNSNLITKVYFPRLIIPLAAVGAGLADFLVASTVLIGMLLYYGLHLSWQLALAPLFLVGILLTATGIGSLLSALTVAYRDFQYVIPFTIQIWFFLTPVVYASSLVPEKYRWLLFLNPMAGLIDGLRSSFFGTPFHWANLGISLGIALFAFIFGASYFRKVERRFADII